MIWQITPLGRPELIDRVVTQFKLQSLKNKKLCLIPNGPNWENLNIDYFLKGKADLVLTSKPGKSNALNVAIDYFKNKNYPIVVRDDDDFFTPEGLSEFDTLIKKEHLVVQNRHWVWDGRYLWLLNKDICNYHGNHYIWGGNFAFWPQESVEFPDIQIGEVIDWAKNMKSNGCKIWNKSINHGCIDRSRNDHLWLAAMETVRHAAIGGGYRFDTFDKEAIAGKFNISNAQYFDKPTVKESHEATLDLMIARNKL